MLHKSQNGRSMLEMMFVLAIVGILSLVTFWGYEMAMTRYRANEIIKQMEMFAFHIEQQFEAEVDLIEDFDLLDYQPNGEVNPDIQIAGYAGSFDVDEETTAFEVTLNAVEEDVCERVMASGWEQPFMIYVNNTPEGPCNDANNENEMVFAFNNTLDTEAPDCNLGYGWNAEQQRCEACPAGKHTVNNACEDCPEDSYQDGTECIPCGFGGVATAGATECTCMEGEQPMPGYYWRKATGAENSGGCYPCTRETASEYCDGVKCEGQTHCGGSGSQMFCDNASTSGHIVNYGYCKSVSTNTVAPCTKYSSNGDSTAVSVGTGTSLLGSIGAVNDILQGKYVISHVINPASAAAWCEAQGYTPATRATVDCGHVSYATDAVCTNAPVVHALFASCNTGFVLNENPADNRWLFLNRGGMMSALASGSSGYIDGFSIRALCVVP